MPGIYFVERRPDGRYDVKRADAARVSAITETQEQGIARARGMGADAIHAERVRKGPDGQKWRKV